MYLHEFTLVLALTNDLGIRCHQGDKIGRIFSYWAIVYLRQFF
jgi:hypothetical protein